MISKEFKYNPDARYSVAYKKKMIDITKQNIIITSDNKLLKLHSLIYLKNTNCQM